jgi:acyl-CoA thioester hydrolase
MNDPTPFHELVVRVYYEDTDFSGRVYHASYIRFMERGRTEWLRALGYEHGVLAGEQGVVFAVRRLEIDYLAPAIIDDLLRIETRVAAVRGAAIDFAQTVSRGEQTVATAKILVAALRGGRPMRIPAELRARLEARS